MKRVLYLAASLFFVTSFMSCEKDLSTEGISKTTYFPEVTLLGNEVDAINVGQVYDDLGVSALANGENVPTVTTVVGQFVGYSGSAIDIQTPNRYIMTYTATNEDGYSASVERTVYVAQTGNFTSSVEGLYISRCVRTPGQGAVPATMDLQYVIVWKSGVNTYQISDALGGYYDLGRGYGNGYIGTGVTFTVDFAGNTVTTVSSTLSVASWGDSGLVTGMSIDAANKKLVIASAYAGMVFTSTLTQVQL